MLRSPLRLLHGRSNCFCRSNVTKDFERFQVRSV